MVGAGGNLGRLVEWGALGENESSLVRLRSPQLVAFRVSSSGLCSSTRQLCPLVNANRDTERSLLVDWRGVRPFDQLERVNFLDPRQRWGESGENQNRET